MTRVVHCKREKFTVYIGRPGFWGNPYLIGKDGTRGEVIEKYRQFLAASPALCAQAREELRGEILGCFCHPLACHGDVLARVAEGGEA